ncbi:LOW QUALITY PROTEIN: NLR family CARD domain-containing protein 3-like [Oncorhynchus clarkii lewisi]|uniref:LOW QUALITY PROTEIN: NLR family CARD domain-containing protein 3-like n=1 Tax=Oncorhynchus clarkii lewisi TaxID=490388 RepID=UPI0039B9C349
MGVAHSLLSTFVRIPVSCKRSISASTFGLREYGTDLALVSGSMEQIWLWSQGGWDRSGFGLREYGTDLALVSGSMEQIWLWSQGVWNRSGFGLREYGTDLALVSGSMEQIWLWSQGVWNRSGFGLREYGTDLALVSGSMEQIWLWSQGVWNRSGFGLREYGTDLALVSGSMEQIWLWSQGVWNRSGFGLREYGTDLALVSGSMEQIWLWSQGPHGGAVGCMKTCAGKFVKDSEELGVICQRELKYNLKKKFQCVFEGIAKQGNPTLLNKIYAELYITEGGTGEVNNEHELRQIETTTRKQARPETAIKCNDIFKPLTGQDKMIRTVLTKGVAGIGKTVSVQKFILDWAEGKANQDVQFVFSFPFRELNMMKEDKHTFIKLLNHFSMETKQSRISNYDKYKVLFIFDGLDECRLPLDFQKNKICCDVTESTSVDVLLTNLIKGNLLPSALLWITTRPAAANKIPSGCVDQVTEVRGFSDPQKEEYFRKRFSDEDLASRIISHIKTSRSLHIMCHIPVFCWISAIVLELMLKHKREEIPKTLTEMYTHLVVFHTTQKNEKYPGKEETGPHWNKEIILSLGKLAFQQLVNGNLIFYEGDLKDAGIDVNEASVYSGLCTQLFKEECGLYQDKVYCFVHLSIQEFLAAVYVFLSFNNNNENLMAEPQTRSSIFAYLCFLFRDKPEVTFYKSAVDKALQSETGNLDLFLRFLLGLSLESNQKHLRGLLTTTRSSSQSHEETVKYIKEKIRENPSPERCINLFHCLNELNDHSLVEEIQSYLRSGSLSGAKLSPAQWSALVFVLLTSEKELDVFDLKKYSRSEEGLLRLLPVVKASKVVLLSGCGVTEEGCASLVSALKSNPSHLRELDLSNNDLKDSGVKLLSAGLGNPHCKLETLKLSHCLVTEEGCASLASALRSNPSHLRELDLSYNHPGDSGVSLLSAGLQDPHCRLEKLNVEHGGEYTMKPGLRKYVCDLTLDPNTVYRLLSLSEENRKVTLRSEEQPYPDDPERFENYEQVLCREGLTGRCYWEVEWSGRRVDIGVTYKGISRKGRANDFCLGYNDTSWTLFCYDNSYIACHNNNPIAIDVRPSSFHRVGVYLDWPAGTLSFYRVSSDTLTHLYTFTSTFTEPLYPGFRVWYEDSSVSLCQTQHDVSF